MKSWKKWGSPYDPSYEGTGKIKRPPTQEEELRDHQLRGCGDPACSMCNPETAALGITRRPEFTVSSIRIDSSGVEAAMRAMSARMEEMARIGAFDGTETRAAAAGPPASYQKARKDVEKWIISAPEQRFDDIVGNEDALAQLRDAIKAPVEHSELYKAYGMAMPKGALLSGPPGCGKTMFARAAASEMRALYGEASEFISISGSELQSMYVGETEGRIKAIFTFAREYRNHHGHPLLVFMDEAEVLLPDRTGRVRRVASWEESQVATFLAEMDGMQESGAFILLATNRPEVIDQAVLRDGRCDFKIVVKRPTPAAVEAIVRKNFEGVLLAGDEVERNIEPFIFAAVEALQDPHKVILEAHAIGLKDGKLSDLMNRHFLLEHIVSGAIAASIPRRAKRYAFARDKADGVARGVTVDDVIKAVNDIFAENRGLDHSFALNEFRREFEADLKAEVSK